jgi:hypothetical protein
MEIRGKSDVYDCDYDKHLMFNLFSQEVLYKVQYPAAYDGSHVGIIPGYFEGKWSPTGNPPTFPVHVQSKEQYAALYGQTCVFDTKFTDFNRKCSDQNGDPIRDAPIRTNPLNYDITFPVTLHSGNSKENVHEEDVIIFDRPNVALVQINDCVDMFCEGLKKVGLHR